MRPIQGINMDVCIYHLHICLLNYGWKDGPNKNLTAFSALKRRRTVYQRHPLEAE
jgi:hypothetical protein